MKKGFRNLAVLVATGILLLPLGLFLIFAIPEKTAVIVVDIPDGEEQLVIKEYRNLRDGDIYFCLRRPWHWDKVIGRGAFNEPICPFQHGNYELIWQKNAVIARYEFYGGQKQEDWAEVRLELSQ